jgi:cathepsin L
VADFKKPYAAGSDEYNLRQQIFTRRLEDIRRHNAEGHPWKKGVNHLTDRTDDERRRLNGRVPDSWVAPSHPSGVYNAKGLAVPASLDYRQRFPPMLTAVKDQGMCGSCWAHAATESVESHFALLTGKLFVLSQQQVSACTPNEQHCGGTGGCNGATAELAFDYVTNAGGQTQEWMLPYAEYEGVTGTCAFNRTRTTPMAFINGYVAVPRNNDAATAEALASVGPLAISVQAWQWPDYESGVFTGCTYNISMDHAVQLIGYGTDAATGLDYWLVRNSWSASWGEHGYIRLVRNSQNETCGWNVDWNTAGGGCPGVTNNTVWACGQCGILYDVIYPNATR